MHVLAICRDCEEPFMPWVITRPPPLTETCDVCGGAAVVARGNDASEIAALLDEVYRGAPQRKRKLAALKIASRIASGQMPYRSLAQSGDGKASKGHTRDASAGHILSAGFVAGAALLYVITRQSTGASLDDQVREIALNVLKMKAAEDAWIPGPGEPTPVLGKSAKPKRKKGNQGQSQTKGRTETSGEPKSRRRGSTKAKNKKT